MKRSPSLHRVVLVLGIVILALAMLVAQIAVLRGLPPLAALLPAHSVGQTWERAQGALAKLSSETFRVLETLKVLPGASSPEREVQDAWRRAQQAGAYRFATRLVQTTYPAPALVNVGRSSRQETVYLEGDVNLPQRTMLMSLWQGGGSVLDPRDGVEVRIEGNQAYGRPIGGEWQQMDNFAGSFAPGNDALAYLAGAKNVQRISESTNQRMNESPTGDYALRFTPYVFDLDGPAFADYMRDQLEQQLREAGELPPGVYLDTAEQFRDAIGDGEVWIDDDGLPLRLTMHVEYPQQRNGERIKVDIQTDFSNFPRDMLAQADFRSLGNFGSLLRRWPSAGPQAGVGLAVLGLMLGVVIHRRSRKVYVAVVSVIILSMVVSPLLQSDLAYAFSQKQAARRAEYEQQQEDQRAARELQEDLTTSNWNPHADPLSVSSDQLSVISDQSLASNNQYPIPNTLRTTQQQNNDDEPAPDSDEDGDGLTYAQERQLGTIPDDDDTDGDQLTDNVEVQGFWYNGRQWYSDPRNIDTNNDGLIDTHECPQRIRAEGKLSPTNDICQDTDGDGTPDLFDRDDDNDGVPDRVDRSPYSVMDNDGSPFDADDPLLLRVDDAQAGEPLFVDFQLRPETADHLWYALNVLDWPSGDEAAQIKRRRGNDSTFQDLAEREGYAPQPRDENGDMRLVPMLEIEIPYKEGHYGNLPVLEDAPITRTGGITVGQWLDTSKLAPYGINVREKDESDDLLVYAPLYLVQDETGGARVAFATRVPYWPRGKDDGGPTDWGSTHQVRVVWLVVMLVDVCKETPCDQAENWDLDQQQVVHAYDEAWTLTGLSVHEDHGLEVAIVFEDPAVEASDEDRRYDFHLWDLAHGLEASFVQTRDEDDDGQQDITIDEMVRRWDSQTNHDGIDDPTDEERWNIPITATQVITFAYEHVDYMAHVMMTETVKILDEHFTPYKDRGSDAPTLVFAQEQHSRDANLQEHDLVTQEGNSLTVKLDPEECKETTSALLSWAPYRYRNDKWESYPIAEYWDKLEVRLQEIFPPDPDDGADAEDIAKGHVKLAKAYYLQLYRGQGNVVQIGATVKWDPNDDQRDSELAKWVVEVAKRSASIGRTTRSIAANLAWLSDFLFLQPAGPGTILQRIGRGAKGWLLGHYSKSYEGQFVWGMANLAIIAVIVLTIVFAAKSQGADLVLNIVNGLGLILAIRNAAAIAQVYLRTAALVAKGAGEGAYAVGWAANRGKDALRAFEASSRLNTKVGTIGFLIAVAVVWVSLIVLISMSGIGWGSLAASAAVASAIAATWTAVILLMIASIPIAGQILAALICLFDALVFFICGLAKSEHGICKGISGWIAAGIQFLLFEATIMVDLGKKDRLEIRDFEQGLADPAQGIAVGNSLVFSTNVKSTIDFGDPKGLGETYWWQYNENNLRTTNLQYRFWDHADDFHQYLSRRETRDEKQEWDGGLPPLYMEWELTTDTPMEKAGINQPVRLFLSEGHAVPIQVCWTYGFVPVCTILTERDTSHMNLGARLKYDIFPSSLDGFYALAEKDGGYALAWGQEGDSTFPRLKDADGDGLINKADGGSDPDDSKWDTDGDGLSDYYEAQTGSNPWQRDVDNDGLDDYQEALLETDPNRADSDSDGLLDSEEVFHQEASGDWVGGWEFVYGFDAAGTPLRTWVTADPLSIDPDVDELTDFQERAFGFHPQVPTESPVLTLDSKVRETNAPQLLLHLDETEGATTFSDSSGYDNPGTCAGDTCPAAGHEGKYVNAVHFDGTDDYVTVSGANTADFQKLTIAAWVKLEATGGIRRFVTLHDEKAILRSESGQLHFYMTINGGFRHIWAPGVLPVDTWIHVAGTYDGQWMRLYVDGNQVGSQAIAGTVGGGEGVQLSHPTETLDGLLDDVAVYDRALSQAEIKELKDGRYNTADRTVRPGDPLYYQARVKNELNNRYAQGLLSTDFPGALESDVPPETFVLQPDEQQVMAGDVTVRGDAASGVYTLTQVAGALITNWREESDFAELLLHLDEAAGATTFEDSSGNQPAHDGECSGDTCPTAQVQGAHGYGLEFDGVDDYVTVDDDNVDDMQELTIAAWVKLNSQPQRLMHFVTLGDEKAVLRYSGPGQLHFYMKIGGSLQHIRVNDVLEAGVFQHVAGTYDGSVMRLYLDGEEIGSWRESGTVGGGSTVYLSAAGETLDGVLDEVVIYDRALTATEIQELYGQPVFKMPFDESPGATRFKDQSGFGNDGACSGANCPTAGEAGTIANAVEFRGDDYVSIAGTPNLDLGDSDFTVSAWVNPTLQEKPILPRCPFWAEYYDNTHLGRSSKTLYQCEGWPIDHDWGPVGPPFMGGRYNEFSARWTGTFEFTGGDHTFTVYTDDGIRVWLDDDLIINEWYVHGAQHQVTRPVSAGQHRVKVEYYENFGYARIYVTWSPAPVHVEGILGHNLDPYLGRCYGDACPAAGSGGKYGQALLFDGNDVVTVEDADTDDLQDFTIAFWVKLNSLPGRIMRFVTLGDERVVLRYDGTTPWRPAQLHFYLKKTDGSLHHIRMENAMKQGVWQHVIARYMQGYLYVNVDDAVAPAEYVPNWAGGSSDVYLGARGDGEENLDGVLDEVVIYDRSLEWWEIESLRDGSVIRGARLRLPLNEDVGSTEFADASRYENSYPVALQTVGNRVRVSVNTFTERVQYTTPDDVLTPDEWNHVVATFDGGTYRVYVNGAYQGNVVVPDAEHGNATGFDIGRSSNQGRIRFQRIEVIEANDCFSCSEYLMQFKERNGAWEDVWQGEGLGYAYGCDQEADVNVTQAFRERAEIQVYEVRGVADACEYDDDYLGNYAFSITDPGVRNQRGDFKGRSDDWGGLAPMGRYEHVLIDWDYFNDAIPFRGKVDEVTIYKRELSDEEVANLHQAGTIALHLQLDDAPGSTTFEDATGQHDGACAGDTCPTAGVTGRMNQAALFDGQNDYVEVSHDDGLNPGKELTLAAWVKLKDPNVKQKIVGKGGSDRGLYVLGVEGGKLHSRIWDERGNVYTGHWGTIPADTWTHLALAWRSGGDMIGYINGQEVGRISASAYPIGANTHPLRVGAAPWNVNLFKVNGIVDEVVLYRRAFSADEIQTLYKSAPQFMMHFDEAAGATQFHDDSGNGKDGTCTPLSSPLSGGTGERSSPLSGGTGGGCPTAGVKGQIGLAVEYDGVDDTVNLGSGISSGFDEFTWMGWVKGSQGTLVSRGAKNQAGHFQLDFNDRFEFTAASGDHHVLFNTLPEDYWAHVAATYDGSDLKVYVNGSLGAYEPSPYPGDPLLNDATMWLHLDETGTPTEFEDASGNGNHGTCTGDQCPTTVGTGKYRRAASFDGTNDTVAVNGANPNDLQRLTMAAWVKPDSLPSGTIMRFVTLNNDKAALRYDGVSGPGQLHFYMTIGGSIRHIRVNDALEAGTFQHVAGTYDGQTMRLYLDGEQVRSLDIAGTVGSGTGLRLSHPTETLDGLLDEVALFDRALTPQEIQALAGWQPAASSPASGAIPSSSAQTVIGRAQAGGSPFNGRVDEVAMYDRALSAREVRDIYRYQAKWVEDRESHEITVDSNAPGSTLASGGGAYLSGFQKPDRSWRANTANGASYIANQDVVMHISADDPSLIVRADLGVSVDDGLNFTWLSAPPCQDAQGGAAWCPTFDPTEFIGEGRYTLDTRTVDVVGNIETPSGSSTVLVDGTAPQAATTMLDGIIMKPDPHPTLDMAWVVPLYGTVSDPPLVSGDPGSGLTAESVQVTLLDAEGNLAGQGTQTATLPPPPGGGEGGWQVDYVFFEADLTDWYTVTVQTTDQVGNQGTDDELLTIGLDTVPPEASLDPIPSPISTIITSTLTLTGLVTDTGVVASGVSRLEIGFVPAELTYVPTYTIAMYRLDEPAGATSFSDSSDNELTATCAPLSSPLSGGTGGGSSPLSGGTGGGSSPLSGGTGGGSSPLPGGTGGGSSPLPGGTGGGCPSAGHDGQVNQAVLFDGDDWLTVTEGEDFASALPEREFSVVAWVKLTDYYIREGYVSAVQDDDGVEKGWAIGQDNRQFFFALSSEGADDGDGVLTYMKSTVEAHPGYGWYHLAATYDGTTMRLYVNGELEVEDSASQSGDINYPSSGWFAIGTFKDDDQNEGHHGYMDEVAVFSEVLTEGQIRALYGAGEADAGENVLEWDDTTLADSGAGVINTTWSYTLPEVFDGSYQINLRGTDVLGNVSPEPDWYTGWRGEIDTRAPQVDISVVEEVSFLSIQTTYTCWAQDFNLYERTHPDDPTPSSYDFKCPCQQLAPMATTYERTYYHEVSLWYYNIFSDTNRLYELEATCTVPGPPFGSDYIRACDIYGHCTEKYATPEQDTPPIPDVFTVILTPTHNTVLTSTAPVDIVGKAYAADHLASVTVSDGLVPIGTQNWSCVPNPITSTQWTQPWNPTEGTHSLRAVATDCAGESGEGESVTVIVDTVPPAVDIWPIALNRSHRLSYGRVVLSGHATDVGGVTAVGVQIDGGSWQDASLGSDTWRLDWYLGQEPDNAQYTVSALATDIAGHTNQVTSTVTVDLDVPNPVTLTLTSDVTAGGVVSPGMTLRQIPATLTLDWESNTDPAKLLPYEVVWTIQTTQTNQISHFVPPAGPLTSQYIALEAQRVAPTVISTFTDTNQQVDDYGSVYVDTPLTPDYITLDTPGGEISPYRGWMDSGCSLIGTDRRVSLNAQATAALDDVQSLYVTWDSEALRIAWTGANWDYAGDLFIYLDTTLGGGPLTTAFNPFAGTPGTEVHLPGMSTFIWVQDSSYAELHHWNGNSYDLTVLDSSQYQFDAGLNSGQTDLYIPFDLIGVTNPLLTPLVMVAFATEEDAMRLWSAMPIANAVNSDLVIETGVFAGDDHVFDLTHTYVWPSLGPGICPNNPTGLQPLYVDSDLQFGLSTDPAGTTYGLMSSDLFWLREDLLDPNRPADLSEFFTFMDVDHPPVGDGDTISYTLSYANRGTVTATGVTADVFALYALRLNGGDHQVINLGDIAPGESGSVTFQGQVNLAATYNVCLALNPGNPELCEPFRDWAALQALVYDDAHGIVGNPLDWLWADHQVDSEDPEFFDIQQPEYFIGAGVNIFGGYAYDPSGVPLVTLESQPGGSGGILARLSADATPCPDGTPRDGVWTCQWDATAANGGTPPNDGDTFNLRLQATDNYGHSSQTDWRTFVVDTVPPEVTLDAETTGTYSGTTVSSSRLTFSGQVSDDRGVGDVEVCLNDVCTLANVQLEGTSSRVYNDEPGAPRAIGACGGGEIVVTFNVADSFPIGEVGLGFNANHARRNDIQAVLQSPSATQVQVLGPKEGSPYDARNYDVLLNDAAASGLHDYRGNDNTAPPYYDRNARPHQPLRAFQGENSAGTWTLTICDTYPADYDGTYNRSRLVLKPQNTAVPSGDWFQGRSTTTGLDNVEQILAVYGIDLAGNRSPEPVGLTFWVDNVAPVITVTAAISVVEASPNRTATTVLSGTVSDGGRVSRMYASVRTPGGNRYTGQVARDGDEWWYDLQPDTTGTYTIKVTAVDAAGNTASTALYSVQVTCVATDLTTALVSAETPVAASTPISLTARVTNNGGDEVEADLSVAFYVNGSLIGTAETAQALQAGESEDVTITWDVDTPGDYELTIIANDDGSGARPLALCSAPGETQQTATILDVPLVESWNLMSTYVNPFNTDASVVQRPITGQYVVIQGFDGGGQSYYPDLPPAVNTLKDMDAEHGYWIKTVNSDQLSVNSDQSSVISDQSVDIGVAETMATLRVVGEKFAEDRAIELDAGWNLVSYLPRSPLAVADALQSIDGLYTVVLGYDQGALSYYPDIDPSFNTLQEMEPLFGYWIRMTQEGTLQYLTTGDFRFSIADLRLNALTIENRKSQIANPTNTWVNFYGPAHLPVGTVVQAIDPDGVVCGTTVVTTEGQYGLLACYGDDPTTPEDEGARTGDIIQLVVDGQTLGTGVCTVFGDLHWVPLGTVSHQRQVFLPLLQVGLPPANYPRR